MTIPPPDIVTALVEDGCSEFDDTGKVLYLINHIQFLQLHFVHALPAGIKVDICGKGTAIRKINDRHNYW